jgi:hypothetical protein
VSSTLCFKVQLHSQRILADTPNIGDEHISYLRLLRGCLYWIFQMSCSCLQSLTKSASALCTSRNSRRTVSLQFLAFVYAASGLASKCPAFWLRPFLGYDPTLKLTVLYLWRMHRHRRYLVSAHKGVPERVGTLPASLAKWRKWRWLRTLNRIV